MKESLIVLMALIGFAAMSAYAQTWSPALEDSPLSRFSEEDISLFAAARKEALEQRADGSEVPWQNPDTGASGTVTPTRTDRTGGRECRMLRVVNQAEGQSEQSEFWFCKMPDGTWKIASPVPGG